MESSETIRLLESREVAEQESESNNFQQQELSSGKGVKITNSN